MCFYNKEKESQKEQQDQDISKKANKNMGIVRSLDTSCNPQKTITADDHKNDKPKGAKNEISIFVIVDSMAKHLNGSENLFRYKNNIHEQFRKAIGKEMSGSFHLARWYK